MKAAILLLWLLAACQRIDGHRVGSNASGSRERVPDQIYLALDGRDLRMDLDLPTSHDGPVPVVVFLHGGGWIQGDKQQVRGQLGPYFDAGWAVVTPNYRLAPADPAPAAVDDAVCALRWIGSHGELYRLDLRRLVVAGYSAGGHLALLLAMLPDSAGFGRTCAGTPTPRPAAVVNFSGITDVRDLIQGLNQRDFAITWIGQRTDRERFAASVSPLTWVHRGAPPVVTVHGDSDRTVPYAQAQALHRALDSAGVDNLLITVAGAGHAIRDSTAMNRALQRVMAFLGQHGVRAKRR